MKRFGVLILAAALLALWGCGNKSGGSGGTTGGTTGGEGAENTEFKVALLTPGPVSDAGWSAMAYEGLEAIERETGAEISNQQATDAKIRDAMRSYAQDGYDLIIGHGFEYNEPGFEVSADFPETIFISSSGAKSSGNSGAIRFYLEQGFYICGYIAGSISKTGKVGMVGGPKVPSIQSTFKAFAAGAKAANPKVQVLEVFTGKNDDTAAANLATLQLIGQGADVLIHQTNAAAQGFFDACKEKNALAFGSNLNQNDNPSGVVIGSAYIIAEPIFVKLAQQVKDGTYKGGVQLASMADGAIDFSMNPAMVDKYSPELIGKIQEISKQIIDGELEVPKDEF